MLIMMVTDDLYFSVYRNRDNTDDEVEVERAAWSI